MLNRYSCRKRERRTKPIKSKEAVTQSLDERKVKVESHGKHTPSE